MDEAALLAEVDRMEALLAPHVPAATAPSWAAMVDSKRTFITGRRAAITAELAALPPAQPLGDAPCLTDAGSLSAKTDDCRRPPTRSATSSATRKADRTRATVSDDPRSGTESRTASRPNSGVATKNAIAP